MAKNRPGQGARRRERNREKRAKEAYLAGDPVPEGVISRSQRINAKKKQRKLIHERIEKISKELDEMEKDQEDLLSSQEKLKDKLATSTFKIEVRNNQFQVDVRNNLEEATDQLKASAKTFDETKDEMHIQLHELSIANAKMKHQMEEMRADLNALRDKKN